MRAFAVSVATFAVLLAAVPAHASVSKNRATWQLRSPAATAAKPSAPAARNAVLSAYEFEVVRRINAIRADRGRRPLRVSRQLSAAAAFHTNQMGLRGFFEHESVNGAEFWQRVERFYPVLPGRSWSVGENIAWGKPDLSPAAAVREWMNSPPHRANLLSREWRQIGLGAAHFAAAPGTFRGGPVTIVTADFGTRA